MHQTSLLSISWTTYFVNEIEKVMAAEMKPTLRLIGTSGELLISINSTSWHVLDEPDLFPEGINLRKAFGVTWAAGLGKEPPFGILQHLSAEQFLQRCETAWSALQRDKDLLTFSYQYELEREKGKRHGGGMSGGFHVRGLTGSIKTTPKGYCTVRLKDVTNTNSTTEIIDLRKERQIETDDAGYIKAHRRAQSVDWYREMPRILDFCRQQGTGKIEVRLYDRPKNLKVE